MSINKINPTKEQVTARATAMAFGKPLVINSLRSMIVEAVVEAVLPSGWSWCAGDWSGWDFQHTDGTRLEVKQSASLQTWLTKPGSIPRFSIAPSTGYHEGASWISDPGRKAQIYVLAHHPVSDTQQADHREPQQWDFYVLATNNLPSSSMISLSQVQTLCSAIRCSDLGTEVGRIHQARTTIFGCQR